MSDSDPVLTFQPIDQPAPRPLAVEQLLPQHRRLALGHGPLKDRITLLRKIAHADPTDPAWSEELKALEKARFQEIAAQVDTALATNDAPQAARLLEEVNSTPWRVAPPLDVVHKVEKTNRRLAARKARRYLAELARHFESAVAASDLTRAREAQKAWQEATARSSGRIPGRLAERVGAFSAWLAAQEKIESEGLQYAAALHELRQALEQSVSRPALERRYRTVLDHGRGSVPEPLEQQYLSRLQSLQRYETWRNRLLMFGGVCLLGLVAFLVWVWNDRAITDAHVGEALRTVKRLRDDSKILEADTYLQTLGTTDPRAANSPVVIELARRVAQEAAEERTRMDAFRAALREADSQGPTASGAAALARAGALARSPEEKTAVRQVRATHARKKTANEKPTRS